MIIKTERNPYDNGITTCSKREIELKEGLTVLVGCNGSGKTTLINTIASYAKKNDIPLCHFDGLETQSGNTLSSMLYSNNMETASALMSSSEGECIVINLNIMINKLRSFFTEGSYVKDEQYERLCEAFTGKVEKTVTSNKRIMLLDAADSGLSIDNVVDLKEFFQNSIEVAKKTGTELYIVVSANEYEMAHESDCLDVQTGRYRRFRGYKDFKKFILKSREKKELRNKKAEEKAAKRDQMRGKGEWL